MLKASSRWKPIRSATTNAHAIIMGARLITVDLVLIAYEWSYAFSLVFRRWVGSSLLPGDNAADIHHSQHVLPTGGSSRSQWNTYLLIEIFIELETAVRVTLFRMPFRQQFIEVVVSFAFLWGRLCL